MSLLVSGKSADTVKPDESDNDDMNSNGIRNAKTSIPMKPKKVQFSVEKEKCGIWRISGSTKQSKTQPKRSDGTE